MRLLVIVVLVGCAKPPAPVIRNISTTVEPMKCSLPALPEPSYVVGFPYFAPNNLTLVVTKSDLADVMRELAGLREWARAVAQCVGE